MPPPPPPQPRPRPLPLWLLLAIAAAVLGMLLSLAPAGALWPGACPATIRTLRFRAWRLLAASPLGLLAATGLPGLLLPPSPASGYDDATGLPLWSAQDLLLHGSCEPAFRARLGRTLLGVAGNVYDVTDLGLQFYGPGATYCAFAGRDATRSLALGSLAPEDLALGGDVSGVDAKTVQDQHEFYLGKYRLVGKLLTRFAVHPAPPSSVAGA